jgi:hypothetical protein
MSLKNERCINTFMSPGRNAPCHCGSGLKYKKCHLDSDEATKKPLKVNLQIQGELQGPFPGAHADVIIGAQPSQGPYTVVFTLGKPDSPTSDNETLLQHNNLKGDSNMVLGVPEGTALSFEVDMGSGITPVIAYSNSQQHISKLVIEHMEATSYELARDEASRIASYLLNSFSFGYDVPMAVDQVDVIDELSGGQWISAKFPYGYGVVGENAALRSDMVEHAALYREALNTSSDLYAFLCFYKIIEMIEQQFQGDAANAVKAQLKPLRRDRHMPPKDDDALKLWLAPVFPQWYEWNRYNLANAVPRDARGLRLAKVRETTLYPLRNEIAHGLLDDKGLVDVDDPALRKRVKYWLPYTRMMARRLMLERFVPKQLEPDAGQTGYSVSKGTSK